MAWLEGRPPVKGASINGAYLVLSAHTVYIIVIMERAVIILTPMCHWQSVVSVSREAVLNDCDNRI